MCGDLLPKTQNISFFIFGSVLICALLVCAELQCLNWVFFFSLIVAGSAGQNVFCVGLSYFIFAVKYIFGLSSNSLTTLLNDCAIRFSMMVFYYKFFNDLILTLTDFVFQITIVTFFYKFDTDLSAGMKLVLGMTYDIDFGDICESSIFRDTLRLSNFWVDDSAGVSVSLVESAKDSSKFLRCNFASRYFIRALDSHMKQHDFERCITEIILDYLWMPDSWTMTNYGSHNFGLLNNILILAKSSYPFPHIKAGGVVYLPTPWQFYHGIVMSEHWVELTRLFIVDYIDFKAAVLHPLVRSDMMIKDSIARCGKDIEYNLRLLMEQGEKVTSSTTGHLYHWRGTEDIFMKLTCK